jgi:hypothetical protein
VERPDFDEVHQMIDDAFVLTKSAG